MYFIKASYGSNWVVELPQIESTYITLHRFSMKVLRGFASFSNARSNKNVSQETQKASAQHIQSKSSQKSPTAAHSM